jgi:hypothetical protein
VSEVSGDDAKAFENLGLYDPADPQAPQRLALLRRLVELGASNDDFAELGDRLPWLASQLIIRPGPLS